MSHYQKLTPVVMGALMADDGSSNGLSKVHIPTPHLILRTSLPVSSEDTVMRFFLLEVIP